MRNELKTNISECNLITNFEQFKTEIKELFKKYDIEFLDIELKLGNIRNIPMNDFRMYADDRKGDLVIYGYTHQTVVQQRKMR